MRLEKEVRQRARKKMFTHGHWFRALTWTGHVNDEHYKRYLSEFTHSRNTHIADIHEIEPHALAAYCCNTHPNHQIRVDWKTVIQVIIILLLVFLCFKSTGHAQGPTQVTSQIVATCGTPNFTYTVAGAPPWNWAPVTIDTNGNICISGTISATNPSVGSTGAAVPSKATFMGANFGGNLVGLAADASSYLLVDCPGCSGVSPFADNSAFNFGTTGISIAGYVFDDVATHSCTENNACSARINGNRILYGDLTLSGTNTNPFNVQWTGQSVTVSGTVAFSNTTIAVTNIGTFAVQAALNAETTKVIGTARVIGNAGAAFDAATGAAPPANALLLGGLSSGATGGFVTAIPVCDTPVAVNISTAATTLIVTGVSGRHVRICAFGLVTAAANNFGFLSGTGATCGTGTAGMSGGTTSGSTFNLAANSGIAQGSGIGMILRTVVAGDSVCIITSANTQLSGYLSFTIF